MRIALVVTGGVDRSGRERVIPALLWLIERLARRHAVTVYAVRYHHRACTYPLLGATVRDLGRPEGAPQQYAAVRDALDRDGPFDVVHGYWALPAGLAAASAARRLGMPSVVTLDSGELVALDDIGYGQQRTLSQRLAVAATVRLANRVTVCSEYMLRLAAVRGIEADRIPLGVDRDLFDVVPADEGPPWRLLHVASLNAVKDQATLLEAMRLVVGKMSGVHLDIVGEDTLAGAVHRAAWRAGITEHVTFHGFQPSDALGRYYQRAHVNVLSSRHEAAGVAALEAAAAGVPTVGTRVGYVADWAPNRAVAVQPRDPAALADAMVGLLEDRARRRTLGDAAREWSLAHDADWTAARLEQVYEEVAR